MPPVIIPIATLPSLGAGSVQGDDVLPIVDVHDLSESSTGTTKQVTFNAMTYGVVPRGTRTVPTLKQYLANNAVFNVKDFGAVGDGVTDDTAAFKACAAACDALNAPYVFYIPSSAPYYLITDEIVFPTINGMVICGDGPRTSVVIQATLGKRTFVVDATVPGSVNGASFHDFGLGSGDNVTRPATDIFYLNRVVYSNFCRVKCDGGSVAGFHFLGCLVINMNGCEASHNAAGIVAEVDGQTGFNGCCISGCNIDLNDIGIHFLDGVAGTAIVGTTVEGNPGAGIIFRQGAIGVAVHGCYFEHNYHPTNPSQDIYIGSTSFCDGLDIRGCYFNGRPLGETYDYVPLRLGFVNGATIEENYINTGNRFVKCESSFNSANSVILRNNVWGSTADTTTVTTAYIIPPNFANNNNSIIDGLFTTLGGGNFLSGDMPYAMTPTLTGSSTWEKSAVVYAGRSAVGALTKTGSDVAALSCVAPISSTNNQDLRGKLVTLALPALAVGATPLTLEVEVDFGSGAPAKIYDYSGLVAVAGWKMYTITVAVPAAETSLTFIVQIATTAGTFYLGKPVGFIGASLPTDWLYGSQPPYWASSVVPTIGTWSAGDVVWNTAPSPGDTPGWVCTTGGTPGTWNAMADLAP